MHYERAVCGVFVEKLNMPHARKGWIKSTENPQIHTHTPAKANNMRKLRLKDFWNRRSTNHRSITYRAGSGDIHIFQLQNLLC